LAEVELYPKSFVPYHFSRVSDKVEEVPNGSNEEVKPERS
jgi:hypothetical protein